MDNPANDHGGPATAQPRRRSAQPIAPGRARAASGEVDSSDVTARLCRDATDKPALRARLRAARDEFAATNALFDAPPQFLALLTSGRVVATYRPVGGEADPQAFDLAVLAAGGELALPHVVDRAAPLRFLHWPRDGELVRGPFALWQPPPDAAAVSPDIILTPLVGFDRAGNRLGQGAGHYDRAFAHHPDAIRIGVAWSVQEVSALPVDPWDVPLHHIATEREWITP